MTALARKVVLPKFTITRISNEDVGFPKSLPVSSAGEEFAPPESSNASLPTSLPTYYLYPIVLNGDGSLWAEANLYILSLLEGKENPKMATVTSIAEDLAAYKRFLESQPSIDWLYFPESRLQRPTYRFNGHLKTSCRIGELAWSTAKRRMAVVVRFYRWLIEEKALCAEFPLWKEGERYVYFADRYGATSFKRIATTDLSIMAPVQDDPFDGCINDGGKLRPLDAEEQQLLLNALISLGNTEITLIHIFAMVTGARIQSILTFRVKDVFSQKNIPTQGPIRFPVGPGTGIDTKQDKRLVLHIPPWFYELLQTYAVSDRARKRRARAYGGDSDQQYLFLTTRAVPFYRSSRDTSGRGMVALRHDKVGQGVRQYMKDYVIPAVRQHRPSFHYRFHDLRATFGMNVLDQKLKRVHEKQMTFSEALNYVQTVMGHSSLAVTERYVNYRGRLKLVRSVQDDWEKNLASLVSRVVEGNPFDE